MEQIDIVNLALSHLGQGTITSAQLTADVHPSAVQANIFWVPCRDEVLGESNWPFATVTLALSSLDIDDYEWDYVYSYPTLAVSTMWNIFNEATLNTKDDQEYAVKHVPTLGVSAIFCDLEDAIAEYTYKVTDTSLWSTKFVMAFSYRLAASMAKSLTGDNQLGVTMTQLYNSILGEAKRLNNSENRKKPDHANKYIDAR